MSVHETFMKRCLELASNGLGHTLSNPMVGCVIVKDGKIIGEGYHKEFGGPHAEVIAWNQTGNVPSLSGCHVYVNLEPCAHTGKTPPCADMLVKLNPSSVIIAQLDPNPEVSGKGVEKIKSAGITVTTGVLEKEARFLNRRFNTYFEKKRPYIILKWAQTSDGFVAPENQTPGERFIISNEFMHTLVHTWRAQEMGISVGKGTVEHDDPELTVRLVEGKNPIRVIVDRELEISPDKKIFNDKAPTWIYNCLKDETKANCEWIKVSREKFAAELLQHVWSRGVVSLFIEGGPQMFISLIDANCWDEMRVITSPRTLKKGVYAPTPAGEIISTSEINGDRLEIRMNTL